MKTPTSSESGYFYLRISAASLLCICGVWLAAMSFVPSASAWSATAAGSPGGVTWASPDNPVIGMGYNSPGSASFAIYRAPTIGMSPAGTQWQYASVTLYVYYWWSGQWHYYNRNTKTTPWTLYGATATVTCPACLFGKILDVSPIPTTGTYYWTSLIQIVWYNDMRYTSSQWAAWENFYPTNLGTTTLNSWHGNAEMAIHTYAEQQGAGRPWGAGGGYNLYSPTGYIYVLQGLKNN